MRGSGSERVSSERVSSEIVSSARVSSEIVSSERVSSERVSSDFSHSLLATRKNILMDAGILLSLVIFNVRVLSFRHSTLPQRSSEQSSNSLGPMAVLRSTP